MLSNRMKKKPIDVLKEYIFGNSFVNEEKIISITDFYEYVFGNKAEVKPIGHMAQKKIRKTEAPKKTKKKLSSEEINLQRVADLKIKITIFKNTLGETVLSDPVFRRMLRHTNAKFLEEAIFGNTSDSLEGDFPSRYHFATDDDIKKKFVELNNLFHYFTPNEFEYDNAMQNFVVIFKGCKLIADYVEKNNDPQDLVAYTHAYKILVFFGAGKFSRTNPFANLEQYLRIHKGYMQPNPIHDALVMGLSEGGHQKILDLTGWQKFINLYGPKAIQYFQNASAIEKELQNKAPTHLEQASKIAAKLTYERHDEYPALARLCKQYNISEAIFNKCLAINKKIKTHDNLPSEQFDIDGAAVSAACLGYYLLKLPIHDPVAYLLGHVTNCCQSIGGASETCVIDGITRENNGFYILLKSNARNKSNITPPRLQDGRINYEAFSIVGQGYAWLSRLNNLTFDSWENLRPGEGLSSCGLLKLPDELQSSTIFEDVPNIIEYVKNKNTRDALILYKKKLFYINLPRREIAEISLANASNKKLVLLFNPLKENELQSADSETLSLVTTALGGSQDDTIAVAMLTNFTDKITTAKDLEIIRATIGRGGKSPAAFKARDVLQYPERIADGMQYDDSKNQSIIFINKEKLESTIVSLMQTINTIFAGCAATDKLKHFFHIDNVVSINQAKWIIQIITNPDNSKLLIPILSNTNQKDSLSQLFTRYTTIWEALYYLDNACILNKENLSKLADVLIEYERNLEMDADDALARNHLIIYTNAITDFLYILNQFKLLTNENFTAFLEANLSIASLEKIYTIFQLLNRENLLTDEYYKIIIKNSHLGELEEACLFLSKEELLTERYVRMLLENEENIYAISVALQKLNQCSLLNDDNINSLLFENGKYAITISAVFIILHKEKLFSIENRDIFMGCIQGAVIKSRLISDLLEHLHQNKFLTQENFIKLMTYGKHTQDILFALRGVPGEPSFRSSFLTALLPNIQYANDIGFIFGYLNEYKLATPENCIAVLSKAQHAHQIRLALYAMMKGSKNNILISQTNVDKLLTQAQDANSIAVSLVNLNAALLKDTNIVQHDPRLFDSHLSKPTANVSDKLLRFLSGSSVNFEKEDIEVLLNMKPTIGSFILDLIHKGFAMPDNLQEAYLATERADVRIDKIGK